MITDIATLIKTKRKEKAHSQKLAKSPSIQSSHHTCLGATLFQIQTLSWTPLISDQRHQAKCFWISEL